ncbi:MAG: hypothetical protein Q9184_002028 [Pyrenodesmia sp. 2 TL-2023]
MRLSVKVFFILPSVFALEPVSPALASPNDSPHPVVLVLSTPTPLPQTPYLELRHLDLDPRQVRPAAVGAPAQAAADATAKPAGGAAAPVAPVANPATVATTAVTAAPVTPVANPATTAATVVAAPVGAAAPAAPAPAAPADGLIGAHGEVPVNKGPATALTTAPSPKSGVIGMGTLTGQIGVVRTQDAQSEAGLAMDKRFGFMSSWPAAFKVGASVLLGTAVGVGILL